MELQDLESNLKIQTHMVGMLFHPIKTHAEAFMDQKNWESRKNVLAITKTTDNRNTIARFIQATTISKASGIC